MSYYSKRMTLLDWELYIIQNQETRRKLAIIQHELAQFFVKRTTKRELDKANAFLLEKYGTYQVEENAYPRIRVWKNKSYYEGEEIRLGFCDYGAKFKYVGADGEVETVGLDDSFTVYYKDGAYPPAVSLEYYPIHSREEIREQMAQYKETKKAIKLLEDKLNNIDNRSFFKDIDELSGY